MLGLNPHFWLNKRVFITGHTGFMGGWLSFWLQRQGAVVTGYSLDPPTRPNLFHVLGLESSMESRVADIRDSESLRSAVKSVKPDIVIHMAAQALVGQSYQAPFETYSTNVMGTVNLLEAVRHVDTVRAVVNVGSDKCYENRGWQWGYREVDAMGGLDPYSSSKGCAELVTAAYRNSYFNPAKYHDHGVAIASCRAGNVIGGGDWAADRLVPDILQAIEAGKAVVIRNPMAICHWQHVLEPLNGYLILAEMLYADGPRFSEGWNFGPVDDDARTVQCIVERLIEKWGEGARWELDKHMQPHEPLILKLDCSKARDRLNWRPHWGLERTLDSIVAWHKAYRSSSDMQAFTSNQISAYEATFK